jgi:hypothetical protein
MAKNKHNQLKHALLLAFVCASVLLVVLIWADGLSADTAPAPDYYRQVPGSENATTVTPAPPPMVTPSGPEVEPTAPPMLPGLDDDEA